MDATFVKLLKSTRKAVCKHCHRSQSLSTKFCLQDFFVSVMFKLVVSPIGEVDVKTQIIHNVVVHEKWLSL